MRMRFPSRLAGDTRGATIVEFALVAPAMCLLLVGGFEISHTLYTRAILQGVMQKAARDAALENGTTNATTIDAMVSEQAKLLVSTANVSFTRRYYRTFSKASQATAETWTDSNSNGRCDAGEPYQDANRNSVWDSDGGDGGQGGAKDKVIYTVTMTYPRMFPLYKFVGGDANTTIKATTVLANQPYGDQGSYAAPVTRNCA